MTFKRWLSGMVIILLACLVGSVGAQQNLPPADWYAVLETQLAQNLVWINADGVQATSPRPRLENEAAGPTAEHEIRISPDGRYAVIAALQTDGRYGLGIYSFETAEFVKTHVAQPNERINPGGWQSFLPNSSAIAIGFYTVTDSGVTDWRIIEFEMETGDAIAVLEKDDSEVTDVDLGAGIGEFPQMMYATSNSYVFALIPYGIGGGFTDVTAFEWARPSNVVSGPYTLGSEVEYGRNGMLFEARYDANLPEYAGQPLGPIPILNVLTTRSALNETPQVYLNSTDGSMFSPRWAANGVWVAYQLVTPTDGTYWIVRTEAGDQVYSYAGLSPTQIYGTTNGYLMDYEGQTFIASDTLDGSSQPVLYEAFQGDSARVIYVTPPGLPFALTSLLAPPVQQELVTDVNCAGAPAPQLMIGIPARVTFTDGTPLRVRQQPGGTIITELAEGTQFTISAGPVCLNNFNWWQISLPLPDGAVLTGWSAEGNLESYFMEIWYQDGEGSGGTPPLPPAVAITPNAPLSQITPVIINVNPNLLPTATRTLVPLSVNPGLLVTQPAIVINPNVLVDGDCSRAPAQTLAVGDSIITQGSGTLAVRDSASAETPSAQIASGITGTVQGGPFCNKGLRLWRVTFANGLTGWAADGFQTNVYLVKQ